MKSKDEIRKFLKYCTVGAMNTCVTLGVIFVCKSWLGIDPYVSNALGYVCGLVNSFLWNKQWVFRSSNGYGAEAMLFMLGFAVCYVVQLSAVWLISSGDFGARTWSIAEFTISGYGVATLVGNVLYTVCNFLYNRLVTFGR